jgi:hypothetical protein
MNVSAIGGPFWNGRCMPFVESYNMSIDAWEQRSHAALTWMKKTISPLYLLLALTAEGTGRSRGGGDQ